MSTPLSPLKRHSGYVSKYPRMIAIIAWLAIGGLFTLAFWMSNTLLKETQQENERFQSYLQKNGCVELGTLNRGSDTLYRCRDNVWTKKELNQFSLIDPNK